MCRKTFSIAYMGSVQNLSRAKCEKHKQNMDDLRGQTLFKAVAYASTPAMPSTASPDGASTSQPGSSETVAEVVLVGAKFGENVHQLAMLIFVNENGRIGAAKRGEEEAAVKNINY
jgi:hypothetical protein